MVYRVLLKLSIILIVFVSVTSAEFIYEGKWGGEGSAQGKFGSMMDIAVTEISGELEVYVLESDIQSNRLQIFSSEGQFLRCFVFDFLSPSEIAISDSGHIYIYDMGIIYEFSSNGTWLQQISSPPNSDFNKTIGMDVTPNHDLYVLNNGETHGYNRVQYFNHYGEYLGGWGTNGSGDGQFIDPIDIAIASDGTIYVIDFEHLVQMFTSDGQFIGRWGTPGTDIGELMCPSAIKINQDDDCVFIVDSETHRIQRFSSDGTFIEFWGYPGYVDGAFNAPGGIAIRGGLLDEAYIVDTGNHRIQYYIEDLNPNPPDTSFTVIADSILTTLNILTSNHLILSDKINSLEDNLVLGVINEISIISDSIDSIDDSIALLASTTSLLSENEIVSIQTLQTALSEKLATIEAGPLTDIQASQIALSERLAAIENGIITDIQTSVNEISIDLSQLITCNTKWEYTVHTHVSINNNFENELNSMGELGWQVVSIVIAPYSSNWANIVYMRPL